MLSKNGDRCSYALRTTNKNKSTKTEPLRKELKTEQRFQSAIMQTQISRQNVIHK
jgi:hypothetical protein